MLIFYPVAAQAAPFCVRAPGVKNYCYFYDARQCREEAKRLGGRCSANRSVIQFPGQTAAPFCVMLVNGHPQCVYHDFVQCQETAEKQNGICITQAYTLSPIDDIRQNRLRRTGDEGAPDVSANDIPGLPSPADNPLYHPGLNIRLNN